MQRIILSCLLLTLFQSCSENRNCSEFHTGTFELKADDFDLYHIIERSDTLQVETNLKTGDKTIGRIEWISDCKYIFTYLESSNELMKNFIGRKMTAEIYKIEDNTIYFESSIEGFDLTQSFRMKKTD